MATTTTERTNPSAPRSSSRNSRTSRPRSPTKASTATSHAVCLASMASRLDLPTPDPENRPSRWPRRHVAKQFSARMPTSSRGPSRARSVASGGAARTRRARGPGGSGPCPSSDLPSGSSTRPSHASATASVPPPCGSGWNSTVLPGPSRSSAANGMTCAKPWRKPTTSAGISWPSRVSSDRRSPTDTWLLSPSISTTSPDSPTTRPSSRFGMMSRNLARQLALRSNRGADDRMENCSGN